MIFLKVSEGPNFSFSEGRKSPFQAVQRLNSQFFSAKPHLNQRSQDEVHFPGGRFFSEIENYLDQMDVSKNSGTPQSSILIGFSITNHPFWGTPIFGSTQMARFSTVLLDVFVCSVVLLLFLFVCSLFSGWKAHVWKKNMMRWKTQEIILILLPTKAAWTRDEACDIHPLLQANMVNPSTTGTIKSSEWNSINFHQTTNQFRKTWVEIQPQPHPLLFGGPKAPSWKVPNFVSPLFFDWCF